MRVLSLTHSDNQVLAIRLNKLFRSIIKGRASIDLFLIEEPSTELIAQYFSKLYQIFMVTNGVDCLECSVKLVEVLQIKLVIDQAQEHLGSGPVIVIQLLDIQEPLVKIKSNMAVFEVLYGLMLVKFLVDDPASFVGQRKALLKQKTAEVICNGHVFGTLLDQLSQEGERIGIDDLVKEAIGLPDHCLHELARLRLLCQQRQSNLLLPGFARFCYRIQVTFQHLDYVLSLRRTVCEFELLSFPQLLHVSLLLALVTSIVLIGSHDRLKLFEGIDQLLVVGVLLVNEVSDQCVVMSRNEQRVIRFVRRDLVGKQELNGFGNSRRKESRTEPLNTIAYLRVLESKYLASLTGDQLSLDFRIVVPLILSLFLDLPQLFH